MNISFGHGQFRNLFCLIMHISYKGFVFLFSQGRSGVVGEVGGRENRFLFIGKNKRKKEICLSAISPTTPELCPRGRINLTPHLPPKSPSDSH